MVEGIVFIGLAVVALVELGKRVAAKDVQGCAVIVGAAVLGALVAVFDVQLGVTQLTIAQGIMVGLSAVGIHTVARQVG